MAPDIDGVLEGADHGRRDFLRTLIAGAAFAPPLIASFSLDGLSLSAANAAIANQCFTNQTATFGPITFCDDEYATMFRDVFRGPDIDDGLDLGGTGHCALNFTGSAGAAGSLWATVLDATPTTPDEDPVFLNFCLSLSADVLIHRFNNSKGAGLLALFNEATGDKGVALFIMDNGNSDALQLTTVDQAGKVAVLKTVALGSGILENQWYRLVMDVVPASEVLCTVQITGQVFKHSIPSDPNSPLGAQVGTTLTFDISLFDLFPNGVNPAEAAFGEVGIVARAIGAAVDSSVTNFGGSGFPIGIG